MANKNLLEEELKTYEEHKENFLEENLGKYVLIKGSTIIGFFDSEKDAINRGTEKFGNVSFLVKKIELIEPTLNFTSQMVVCEECRH